MSTKTKRPKKAAEPDSPLVVIDVRKPLSNDYFCPDCGRPIENLVNYCGCPYWHGKLRHKLSPQEIKLQQDATERARLQEAIDALPVAELVTKFPRRFRVGNKEYILGRRLKSERQVLRAIRRRAVVFKTPLSEETGLALFTHTHTHTHTSQPEETVAT